MKEGRPDVRGVVALGLPKLMPTLESCWNSGVASGAWGNSAPEVLSPTRD